MKKELNLAIEAAHAAGKAIMDIYGTGEFLIERKNDNSPLTIADKRANEVINSFLGSTAIPIISEENSQLPYQERKKWTNCWIVDPLDGTKEFIKRNGEFTVNISLIVSGYPILGVVYAPALGQLYFSDVTKKKAFQVKLKASLPFNLEEIKKQAKEIYPSRLTNVIKVVGSRSHMNDETLEYINGLKQKYSKEVEMVAKGSSLKFCLVAEGVANIYPRFAPTMEWDTAAGQAICEAVGLKVVFRDTGETISYNRENLLNRSFLVLNEG